MIRTPLIMVTLIPIRMPLHLSHQVRKHMQILCLCICKDGHGGTGQKVGQWWCVDWLTLGQALGRQGRCRARSWQDQFDPDLYLGLSQDYLVTWADQTCIRQMSYTHSHLSPADPLPDLGRLQRVPRHEKLWDCVTWPAWENSNVFLFNWCLYSSEISDCKSP